MVLIFDPDFLNFKHTRYVRSKLVQFFLFYFIFTFCIFLLLFFFVFQFFHFIYCFYFFFLSFISLFFLLHCHILSLTFPPTFFTPFSSPPFFFPPINSPSLSYPPINLPIHFFPFPLLAHPSDQSRIDIIVPRETHFYLKTPVPHDRQAWLVALGSCKVSRCVWIDSCEVGEVDEEWAGV